MLHAQADNPFDLIKASDFSDSEILDYWVDIAGEHGGLVNVLKPKVVMPMLLLGGKGSGKTHLMRYCSAPVQAARHGGSLGRAVEAEGYLGIYIRAEGLNTNKFANKWQDDQVWATIFAMYFELWVVTVLLDVAHNYVGESEINFDERSFVEGAASLFDRDIAGEFGSLTEFIDYLGRLRRNIDYVTNNSALSRSVDGIDIVFSQGRLIYGLPKLLEAHVPRLKAKTFLYLIDEAENFTIDQQKFINTLIRYRSGNATIKVGARLYGIRTYDTLGSGEPIKRDAEYERVELDLFLREQKPEYEKLIGRLLEKRLRRFPMFVGAANDMDVESAFEELERQNHWQEVTLDLVRSYDRANRERPYFRKLASHLFTAYRLKERQIDEITGLLRRHDYPFLEKTNVFLLYKQWPKSANQIFEVAETIGRGVDNYLRKGASGSPDYAQVVAHFGSDLLAQLFRDCRRKVPYAGLKTLIQLSQGIPRNFLSIMKHTYRRSLFAGERPFSSGKISVESQSDGVRDGATWFWEDAQPESLGPEVREAVEALAVLFRTVRFSERPSECDLCTFSVNLEGLSESSRQILNMAENWSYLIRIRDGARNKNTQSVDVKYQLGPMLAPKWEVSEHRRGTIELKAEFANALFDREYRSNLPSIFRARLNGMMAPNFAGQESRSGGLFG